VLLAAAGAIVVQLLVRVWVARDGVLAQDDLVVTGRSARLPLLSADFLLPDGNSLAPLAHLLTGALTRVAPLEYWPMAVTLVLLQAVASLAMLRLLRLLLGDRPVLLLPLLLFLFSPLAVAALDSWSTAVGALPLQAGLAWVCGDAVRMHRTGRRRYAVTATLAFATAVLFGERALVILPVSFAVLAVLLRQSGESSPLVAALRGARWLWGGLVAATAICIWQFWPAVHPRSVPAEQSGSLTSGVEAVVRTITHGILPGLVGGPLSWSDFGTWADPPAVLVAGALAVAVVTVVWVSWRRRGCGVIWALLAAYVGVAVLTLVVGRLTSNVAAAFPLSLRYFADVVPVAAIAVALVARAPAREAPRGSLLQHRERRDVAVLVAAFFVGLSLWSTGTYTQTRSTESTREYLANARESLAAVDAPLLDHAVPASVVWGPAAPDNRISRVFAPIGVETASSTADLQLLGPDGRLVDGRVTDEFALLPGLTPGCGHLVEPPAPTGILLDGQVVAGEWTVQLNYLASQSGWVTVAFERGDALRVPVRAGLSTVYLTLRGEGGFLTVASRTPGLAVCIDTGLVGLLEETG
jgi:hypothetical protein